jgi:hypothetical protein
MKYEHVPARKLRTGDLVDLSKCPFLRHIKQCRFEFGEVDHVDHDDEGLCVVHYENVGLCATYHPNFELHVQRLHEGDTVHVNRDDEQWGRIAENGVVESVRSDGVLVLVGGTIRASVFCDWNEVSACADGTS